MSLETLNSVCFKSMGNFSKETKVNFLRKLIQDNSSNFYTAVLLTSDYYKGSLSQVDLMERFVTHLFENDTDFQDSGFYTANLTSYNFDVYLTKRIGNDEYYICVKHLEWLELGTFSNTVNQLFKIRQDLLNHLNNLNNNIT